MEEREISLKELFSVVWKKKYIIGLVTIIGLVVFGLGGFVYNLGQERTVSYISLQWDGIGKGEYPNGERFDYTEAVEPYVIQAAIDAQGLDLNVQEVREQIVLSPVLPDDIQSIIATALEEGEQITYFATDYKVILNHKELGLTESEARSLIEQIIIEFREDFNKKFISQSVVLDYTGEDFDDLEYVDIAKILDSQVGLIRSKMAAGLADDPNFQSVTGITFNDVIVRTDLVQVVELNQIKSRTTAYLLAKDPEYLAVSYQYTIELKQLELDKELQNEGDAEAAVLAYEGNVITQIVIPGVDGAYEFDTYYDTLIANLLSVQSRISELENDIAYYQLQIDRLNGSVPLGFTTQKQAEEALVVESFIDSADQKLSVIVNDANELLVEYNNYLTSNTIKPLMTPVVEVLGMSTLIIGAIGAILSGGIATLVVLFKHDWN